MDNHEYADIFPMMDKKEYSDLKNDIKQNGLMEPVITLGGLILDGRNRFRACEELGIKPTTKEFDGEDALQYVMSTNLQRRNLNQSQKAMIGRRWKVHYAKINPQGSRNDLTSGTSSTSDDESNKNRDKAGEVAGVSGRYIDMAEEVISKRPEMEDKIMNGEVKIKQVIRDIKIEEQKENIIKENFEKPKGDYDVVVIDPPWKYDAKYHPEGRRGSGAYPEMSLEELKQIVIPAKKDCILWLWVTNNFMKEAHELLEVWGFELKTILTWDKEIMGLGAWLRNRTEHCILAIKGKPHWDNKTQTTIIKEKRTEHSVKPEIFYKMVDEICVGRKLDYFARKKREGWDVYGDEV